MHLYFRSQGEGQPIIILHGLFGSSDNWVSIAKILATTNRVYLLDLRNHGKSFHSSDFTYQAMAEDIRLFIEEHSIEKPLIIGHSMGGKVAMHFAIKYPELPKGLVVVDISPRYYPVHHQQILKGLHAIPIDLLKSRNEADQSLSEYIPELSMRHFLLKNLTRGTDGNFEWRINLSIISENIENVGEALVSGTYEGPTLFIGGANSNYILPSDHDEIRQFFPKAEIMEIQEAGHWVHSEKPAEVTEAVEEFFRKL